VSKLKDNIIRWRKFTKTTLNVEEGKSNPHPCLKDDATAKKDDINEPLLQKKDDKQVPVEKEDDKESARLGGSEKKPKKVGWVKEQEEDEQIV
jgi:hypothetical protein